MNKIQFRSAGPREEITNRLRSLLDGYKDGLSIFKEFFQISPWHSSGLVSWRRNIWRSKSWRNRCYNQSVIKNICKWVFLLLAFRSNKKGVFDFRQSVENRKKLLLLWCRDSACGNFTISRRLWIIRRNQCGLEVYKWTVQPQAKSSEQKVHYQKQCTVRYDFHFQLLMTVQ